MWFRILSVVIAIVLLVKAVVALASPRRFYAARQKQYASAPLPSTLFVPPALVLGLTLSAWYATIFHYQPWGWLVTGLLSLISCLSIHHLLHWESHRQMMLKVVTGPKVMQIDCLLVALGLAFLALALFVY
jgi:hypothetical protein